MTTAVNSTSTQPSIADSLTEFFSGTTQDWNGASFREKFGSSLVSDDEKRLEQYKNADMAKVSQGYDMRLARMATDMVEDRPTNLDSTTGRRRNRIAKGVADQFSPMAGQELRLQIPIRA